MTQETTQENQSQEVIVEDIDAFARHMLRWFEIRSQQLKHLLTVPAGTAFEVGDEEIVLDGDTLRGFKFGVEMAIMQLGTLPFTPHYEEDSAANEAAPQTSPVSNG